MESVKEELSIILPIEEEGEETNEDGMTFDDIFDDSDYCNETGIYNVSPENIRKKLRCFLQQKK
jgi:hypothetical protein